MSAFWKAVKSHRKLLLTWGFLLSLAGIYYLQKHYGLRTVDDYERLFAEVYEVVLWTGSGIVAVIGLVIVWARRRNKKLSTDTSFRCQPWNYDKQVLFLTGRIEKVFHSRWRDRLERWVRRLFRRITASADRDETNPQQRFLISSPQLRSGERLLVVHNESFGSHALWRGMWLEVQGEYVHKRSKRRDPLRRLLRGKLTYYGLIHYTHEPRGFVRRIGRPVKKQLSRVGVKVIAPTSVAGATVSGHPVPMSDNATAHGGAGPDRAPNGRPFVERRDGIPPASFDAAPSFDRAPSFDKAPANGRASERFDLAKPVFAAPGSILDAPDDSTFQNAEELSCSGLPPLDLGSSLADIGTPPLDLGTDRSGTIVRIRRRPQPQ